jgi:hypothetical protein
MPIYKMLEKQTYGPEEILILSAAFEEALRSLGLTDRSDPVTELVAKKIIELANRGERDPLRLRDRMTPFNGSVSAR